MMPRFLAISSLVLCTIFLRGLSPEVAVLMPMMPAGCEAVCKSLPGCWSCKYLLADLSCRLSGYTADQDRGIKHKTWIEKTDNNCSTIDYTPSPVNSTCLVDTEDSSRSRKGEIMTRLLIVPRGSRNGPKQFFLCNKTISEHPALHRNVVDGVAYISKLRKLFIITQNPHQQLLVRLDSTDVEFLGEKVMKSCVIAVDNLKLIAFLKIYFPRRKICKVTIQEKRFENIIALNALTGSMALDTGNEIILLAVVGRGVAKYKYTGSFDGYLFKWNIKNTIIFDEPSNVLYYVSVSAVSICKFDLRKKSHDIVKYLGFKTDMFLVEQEELYVFQCPGGLKGRIMVMNEAGDSIPVNVNVSCLVTIIAVP